MRTRICRPATRAICSLAQGSTTPQPWLTALRSISTTSERQHATGASPLSLSSFQLPADYVPPTKPPSARPPETRKSQLIRTYTSLLRSTPLILFFQHNNLTAVEWAAIRRELNKALASVTSPTNNAVDITPNVQLQVLRTRMFTVALKVVEFFDADKAALSPKTTRLPSKSPIVHDLSAAAYESLKNTPIPEDSPYAQISPLLVGPLAALVFPAVSPAHLAAALRILAPSAPRFPAPTRRANPGYHDPTCQNALAKLLLVGGRIEDKVFDMDGVRWVGGIEGGLDGLRAQLVYLLQGAGLGLTSTLEAGGKSLWLTLEGRKGMLEDEAGGKVTEVIETEGEEKKESEN